LRVGKALHRDVAVVTVGKLGDGVTPEKF